MGTTSEKLTYLNGTKQLLKDKINNLGGSIDDNTTFRQYANQLQNVYDNLPKTEYQEGSSITLENTLKGKLDFEDGIVGIGDTKQDTTQGYQLLGLPNYTETKAGVTVTIKDGEVSMSGTTTSGANFDIPIPNIVLNTTDTFSVAMNDNTTIPESFGRYLCTNNSGALIRWNYGMAGLSNHTGFSPNENTTATYFRMALNNANVNYTGLKFKIMFEKGSTTHTFEKYTGGIASPNPSYPQDIEVVRGKNLSKEKNGNNIVITDTLEAGTYTFSLDNTINGGFNLKANSNSGTTLATLY